MMVPATSRVRVAGRKCGFTLVEVLLYLAVSGILLSAVVPIMIAQVRASADHRQITDVQETLRSGVTLLSWELRHLSAEGGDLISMAPDSLVVRATTGSGIVCVRHDSLQSYGVWGAEGELSPLDSALAFVGGTPDPSDDSWLPLQIQSVATTLPSYLTGCDWSGPASVPELAVGVTGDTAAVVEVGAPLRAFRHMAYGIYSDGTRFWLGRKAAGAASWERLAGPLLPPPLGLELAYLDRSGLPTGVPDDVRQIGFVLRAQSEGKARKLGQFAATERMDSVNVHVTLRR